MNYLRVKKREDFRPGLIFGKLKETYQYSRSLFGHRFIDFHVFFFSAIFLYIKSGFMPKEVFNYGLWGSKIFDEHDRQFCSKNNMLRIQSYLNPRAWQEISANKGIFSQYCQALNIPVPRLYGIFFSASSGWSHTGAIMKNKEDWIRFIDEDLPDEFVVKPATGAYGKGLSVFERADDIFYKYNGDRYSAVDIVKDMQSDQDYDSFIIQERLKSHPEIVRLSGSENLQTARIITFIDRSGNCHLLHAFLKAIVGENVIDNIDSGRTGNLIAEIMLDEGALKPAILVDRNGSGCKSIERHPVTGVRFEGFKLPLWEQACSLAKEAAVKFLPKRTIGWDIALTPRGVLIVEGNGRYDPPLSHRNINEFISILTEKDEVI